jgi:hypothetical protein
MHSSKQEKDEDLRLRRVSKRDGERAMEIPA